MTVTSKTYISYNQATSLLANCLNPKGASRLSVASYSYQQTILCTVYMYHCKMLPLSDYWSHCLHHSQELPRHPHCHMEKEISRLDENICNVYNSSYIQQPAFPGCCCYTPQHNTIYYCLFLCQVKMELSNQSRLRSW